MVLVNLPTCGCFFEVNVDKSSIHGAHGTCNVFLVEILIPGNRSILVFFSMEKNGITLLTEFYSIL